MSETGEARLILDDGTIFSGRSFGARGRAGGEVVFNTCLSGYQEILTDPSYRGQIVTMTNPLIGNYGMNLEDSESERGWLAGFVVRELADLHSNFRATESLQTWLERHGVIGIEGVDTRALTRRIRTSGAMKGLISTETVDPAELRAQLDQVPELEGRDLVREVTRGVRMSWEEGLPSEQLDGEPLDLPLSKRPHVVAVDLGAKANIFRSLVSAGFRVTVVPATASSEEILALQPDGVLLSNGPGDPRVLTGVIAAVRGLLGKVPLFGICLGHQVLAAAIGARIFKLEFGHHGGNQPVKDLRSGAIEITSQNHGFAVDRASLEEKGGEVTHVHLNDGTVAGLCLPGQRAMSVQYHPEACPGPHDALHLFRRFRQSIGNELESV